MDNEYSLLTSTRYDPFLKSCRWNDDHQGPQPFLLLSHHLDRLISAAEAHSWPNARSTLTYSHLKNACTEAVQSAQTEEASTAFKLRITVSKEGPNHIHITTTALPNFSSDPTIFNLLSPSPPVRVYLDTEPTIPSIFTQTKTTFRDIYNRAKQRNETILSAVPGSIDADILLYNPHGQIMETTIFNVAFYRDSQWTTPAATSGCLSGIMRRCLLENGRIQEDVNQILMTDAIHEGERVLLFNAVQGCRIGTLYRVEC